MRYRYLEGSGLAVVGGQVVAYLPDGERELADAISTLVQDGRDLPDLIGAMGLTSRPTRDWASFVLLSWHGEALTVLVRGPVEVRVRAADGMHEINGLDVMTWRDHTVRGALGWQIGSPVDAELGWDLDAGTVRAGGLELTASVGTPTPESSQESAAALEVTTGSLTLIDGPLDEDESEAGESDVVEPIEPAARDLGFEEFPAGMDPDDDSNGHSVLVAGSVTDSVVEETGYGHLWGATRARSIEEAAIRADDDGEQDAQAEAGTEPEGTQEVRERVQPESENAVPVDLVHDGQTIGPAALAELRKARQADTRAQSVEEPAPHLEVDDAVTGPLSGGAGVMVLARTCQSGHANPPERSACWLCGREVDGEAARHPRPALGSFRLAAGESSALDATYVVGRRPRVGRTTGEVPRVLAVPSPQGEVSATHLTVRLEDWHVLAIDQSRNGTVLYRDGEEPRRLAPNDATILRSDDQLDLGDGVLLTFEGLP